MDDVGVTSPIVRASGWPQRKLFNVAEYYRMAEAGIFSEHPRVELIEGEILEMAAIGIRHIGAVMAVHELLFPAAVGRFRISIQNPLRLDDRSEPQPDVVLLRPRADNFHFGQQPMAADAKFVAEVADSSLEYDKRVKMPLYARSAIAESCLVDVDAESITVFRVPTHDGYADAKTYYHAETIEPIALPGASILVADVFTR